MMGLELGSVRQLVLLGAHCDDLAIGAGASIAKLCRANPGLDVSVLVLTGAGTVRAEEEGSALSALCPGARLSVTVAGLSDGWVPAHWSEAKEVVTTLRDRLPRPADLVLAPQLGDAHQDHRLLAELATQTFRDTLVLGYEILKYESDLPTVNAYLPVSEEEAEQKVAMLQRHYPSQLDKHWFDAATFLGLMRVRGAQCNQPFAEGFVANKITLGTGG